MEDYWTRTTPYERLTTGEKCKVSFGCLGIVAFIILLVCLLTSCGTRKQIVTVPQTHIDTLYISKHERDSIWLHDSIHVTERQQGDTIYLMHDRWHTKYVERQVRDTIYHYVTDSIPQPYPVTEYVERQLTWWQRVRLWLGTAMLIIIAIYLGWQAFKLWRMLHPV